MSESKAPVRPHPHERRAHPRVVERRWSCCYLDGHRFDTESLDIGPGGVFLETADADVPVGAPMVVVFDADPAADGETAEPIYLVGRVMRRQKSPPGLGVAWARAVTSGDEVSLERFLRNVLRIPANAPRPEMTQSGGKRFAEFRHVDLVPIEQSDEPRPAPASPEARRPGHVGPLTEMVKGPDTELEVSSLVRANMGGTVCDVTLVRLGAKRIALLSSVRPIDHHAPITVELPIQGRNGEVARVLIEGRVVGIDPAPGHVRSKLRLRVTRIEDDSLPGGLAHYLKRLACARMTRAKEDSRSS